MIKHLKYTIIVFAFLLSLSSSILSIDFETAVREGNEAFNKQEYDGALEKYQIAEAERPEIPELDYNMAGVLYQQGKYEEAVKRFTNALNTTDIKLEGSVSYNLGNTYFKMGDYQKAIQSYQSSLERNPDDMDAKYNLELSRRLLKEQLKPENQEKQEQQEKQKQQEEEQQQQKEQKEQKEQQQGDDQQNQNDEKEKKQEVNQEEKENKQPKAKPAETKMSKEDAERILNALRDDEQDVQKKIKREIKGGNYNGKDW